MRRQRLSVKAFLGAALAALLSVPFAGCTSGSESPGDAGSPDAPGVNPCGPGTAKMCKGTCVDVQNDFQNCGDCGVVCGSDKVCSHGSCAVVCGGGTSRCGNSCVDLKSSPRNCGGCGSKCPSGEVCSGATCALTCQAGLTNCSGACVDTTGDDANCNGCGNACPSGQHCVGGACSATCASPWSSCDTGDGGTICVDVTSDSKNCNGCGSPCSPGQFCNNGTCQIECAGGTTLCNSACVDESIDPNHCGDCNTTCGNTTTCSNRHCCPNATPFYCGGCDTFTNCVQKSANHISAGEDHTCAITPSGGLKCWGNNSDGDLGNSSTTTEFNTPQDVSGLSSGVAAVAAFEFGACAVTLSGSAYCWGDNFNGELGNNSTISSTSPVAVSGISNALGVAGGGEYANCFLLSGGGVSCDGRDQYGNLALGSITTKIYKTPQTSTITGALTIGGTGVSYLAPICAILNNGSVECWGHSDYSLGDGATNSSGVAIAVSGVSNAVQLAVGPYHVCAILQGGAMKCWGDNGYGQLGDGNKGTTANTAVTASIGNIIGACTGGAHTCVVLADGSVQCIGYNGDGQLGNGTTSFTATTTWQSALGSGAVGVACGYDHTCALTADGKVYCWGYNGYGDLGDGTYVSKKVPTLVSGF